MGENVLDDLRKSRMELSDRVMELLFETVDMLKVLVEDVGVQVRKQGEAEDPDHQRPHPQPRGLEERAAPPRRPSRPRPPPGDLQLPAALPALARLDRKAGRPRGPGRGQVRPRDPRRLLPAPSWARAFNPFSMFQMVELVGRLLHRQMVPREPQVDLDSFDPRTFHLDLVMLIEARRAHRGDPQGLRGASRTCHRHLSIH